MSFKRIILVLIGIFILIAAAVSLWFRLYYVQPADISGTEQVFTVREGTTLRRVAAGLEDKGIIKNRQFFIIWARLKGYGRRIKSGEYLLSPSMTPEKIFDILTRGIIITHPVTFPEGFSLEQIGETLSKNINMDKSEFLSLARDPENLTKYGISGDSLEGYLYPDTYQFGISQSPGSVIDIMMGRFREVVSPLIGRMDETGMPLEEVVILASIIEKETGRGDERPMIASVFLNRLKKGMRLESDPTVIYGIEGFNGNLTREDLRRYSPYNTYVIKGLPRGPICNPGLDSIRAVLYPAETDYLYFVSKNDGSHYFSRTLEEHNRHVYLYQKKRINP